VKLFKQRNSKKIFSMHETNIDALNKSNLMWFLRSLFKNINGLSEYSFEILHSEHTYAVENGKFSHDIKRLLTISMTPPPHWEQPEIILIVTLKGFFVKPKKLPENPIVRDYLIDLINFIEDEKFGIGLATSYNPIRTIKELIEAWGKAYRKYHELRHLIEKKETQ